MPVYTYKCLSHHEWDESRAIAERDDRAECPECGAKGKRIFNSAPTVPWFSDCTRSENYYKEKRRV